MKSARRGSSRQALSRPISCAAKRNRACRQTFTFVVRRPRLVTFQRERSQPIGSGHCIEYGRPAERQLSDPAYWSMYMVFGCNVRRSNIQMIIVQPSWCNLPTGSRTWSVPLCTPACTGPFQRVDFGEARPRACSSVLRCDSKCVLRFIEPPLRAV